jgi:hypothetical protein
MANAVPSAVRSDGQHNELREASKYAAPCSFQLGYPSAEAEIGRKLNSSNKRRSRSGIRRKPT